MEEIVLYLDLEELGLLVPSFGHVDGNELKIHFFLEKTGQNPRYSSRHGRSINFHRRSHWAVGLEFAAASLWIVQSVLVFFYTSKKVPKVAATLSLA